MKTMNLVSRIAPILGLVTTLLAITVLDTLLRPGDEVKGWILAAGIWGYLLIFRWLLRRHDSGAEQPGSATSQHGRSAGGHY
jgi:uncharacterized membrane protein YdjX (TVP38/TMEM64 family)